MRQNLENQIRINIMLRRLKGFRNFFNLAFCFIVLQFLFPHNLLAQQNNGWQEIILLDKNTFNTYVEFISDDIKDYFNPQKEKVYPSSNLFDGDLTTCWVSGFAKANKNAALYIRLPDDIDLNEVILNIFSGDGRSRELFYADARPKKINLSLFVAFHSEGFGTEVARLYVMKKAPFYKVVNLMDTFGIQSFPLDFKQETLLEFQSEMLLQAKTFLARKDKKFAEAAYSESLTSSFILKIEFFESYQGLKSSDVYVSELFFNDRFITPNLGKNFKIWDVYIKDDNTLLADFEGEKGVVIFKDTAVTFTYVDWPKNNKWAILYYVSNDAVGEGSRVEEQYALIDLKNREMVNAKFEKCTGRTTMFIHFEADEAENTYVKEGKYKIELK